MEVRQKLNVEQNSDAWHKARECRIGSSDIPIILGLSPWKTALELYEEKLGLREKQKGNYATSRGHSMEAVVRQKVEFKLNALFPATTFTRGRYISSLDGYDSKTRTVLEIKNPGIKSHAEAQDGKIPVIYYPQVQQQLFVSGAKRCVYASYYEDELITLETEFNPKYWKTVEKEVELFLYCLDNKVPPAPSERDYVATRDEELTALCCSYTTIKEQIAGLEKNAKRLQADIKKRVDSMGLGNYRVTGDNADDASYKITTVFRKGNVDYAKVPELQGVDLEPFRKAPITYIKVSR